MNYKSLLIFGCGFAGTATYFLKNDKKSIKDVKLIKSDKIKFRNGHEDIKLNSISLRHRMFENAKDSYSDKNLFKVGGLYNWYYFNREPIKCWKNPNKKDEYIIQDGHRRFIEGNIQGYENFLVEVTGYSHAEPSNEVNLITPQGFDINYENNIMKINSKKVKLINKKE